MSKFFSKKTGIIPGFNLTFSYTTIYLLILLILPLIGILYTAFGNGFSRFKEIITSDRVIASYKISFMTALFAAIVNAVFGTIIAWTLVRYKFPFRKLLDALVDLPFALPTAVAGISLATLFSPEGWIGKIITPLHINAVNSQLGITIALIFIGFPFVVRNVQPVLEEFDKEVEEAAAILGANRFQVFKKVIFPNIVPSILTGFTLAFARALGEYGSVIFISGNIPFETEITPLLIMAQLDQFDYAGAAAIASALLGIALLSIFILNLIQYYNNKKFVR